MALLDKIKSCPHCGSDEGYHYRLTIVGVQYMAFGGVSSSSDDFVSDPTKGRQGVYRCDACGKVIRAT